MCTAPPDLKPVQIASIFGYTPFGFGQSKRARKFVVPGICRDFVGFENEAHQK
jgi:hypothetical protein